MSCGQCRRLGSYMMNKNGPHGTSAPSLQRVSTSLHKLTKIMDISFTQRLNNITALTEHLVKTQGKTSSDARALATRVEEDYFTTCTSAEQYRHRCSQTFQSQDSDHTTSPDEEIEAPQDDYVNHIFNTEAPAIGKYFHPTFHANGRTSTVYKAKVACTDAAQSSLETIVALKVTHPDRLEPPHNSRREARLLAQARHGSIVPLLDTFEQPGGVFVLVFPFARLDLENVLRSDTLDKSLRGLVFTGLFSALAHIHARDIIHRDVKPSNILFKSVRGPVYLIDFGIAWSPCDPESESASQKITDIGTTCYRPPEVLFGYRSYGPGVDIWAAGCITVELLREGHHQLFDAGPLGSELGLIKSIFETLGTPTDATWSNSQCLPDWGKVRFRQFPGQSWDKILPNVSAAAIEFTRRAICFDWTQRLTARAALHHQLASEMGVTQRAMVYR